MKNVRNYDMQLSCIHTLQLMQTLVREPATEATLPLPFAARVEQIKISGPDPEPPCLIQTKHRPETLICDIFMCPIRPVRTPGYD